MIKVEKLSETSTYHVEHDGEMYFAELSAAKTGYKFDVLSKNGEAIHDYNTVQDIENYIFETFINKK